MSAATWVIVGLSAMLLGAISATSSIFWSRRYLKMKAVADGLAAEITRMRGGVDPKIGEHLILRGDNTSRYHAPQAERSMLGAVHDIGRERLRQVRELGHGPEEDDAYARGELALAATAYLMHNDNPANSAADLWPCDWAPDSFKPKSRREDLVRAGALIAAEIDRLDRAAMREQVAKVRELRPLTDKHSSAP